MEGLIQQTFATHCSPGKELELGAVTYTCNGREIVHKGFVAGVKTLREFYVKGFNINPKADFIIHGERRLTFEQVEVEVRKLMRLFLDMGISPGDHIAILSRNLPEWCFVYMAVTWYGAVAVPLNSWWSTEELEYGLRDSAPKLLFCDVKRRAKLEPFLGKLFKEQGLRAVVYPENGGALEETEYSLQYLNILDKKTPLPDAECPPDVSTAAVACIMYTSGTTGNPKGVMQTHSNTTQQMRVLTVFGKLQANIRAAMKIPDLGQDASICALPLFHTTALNFVFLAALVDAKRLVLMSKWDAGEALKLIEKEKPRQWAGVPTMAQDMMEHPDFAKYDLSSLTVIGGGGAPNPPSQINKVSKLFGEKVGSSNGYGLTETSGAIAVVTGPDYAAHPTSCGKALFTTSILIIDADQAEEGKYVSVDAEVRGELVIKGPAIMAGYYNKKESTDKAIIEVEGQGYGWFRTGDIGRLDKEGYIYIMDRAKDIIIRGGENISCAEVESAIYEHPDVLECAVYGVKDERLGEVVGCRIVLKPLPEVQKQLDTAINVVRDDILALLKKSLAPFKLPVKELISFQKDPLPRGGTGKIMKRIIRAEVNASRA